MAIYRELILCVECKGTGKKELSERYDYHHGYDWVWDKICSNCGGPGRMIKVTEITYEKLTKEDLNLREKPEGAERD